MSEYRVDKGVPIPSTGRGRKCKYPWAEMKNGDSFAVPVGDLQPSVVVKRLSVSGIRWCQRNRPDLECVVARVGDRVRVWLVKKEDL